MIIFKHELFNQAWKARTWKHRHFPCTIKAKWYRNQWKCINSVLQYMYFPVHKSFSLKCTFKLTFTSHIHFAWSLPKRSHSDNNRPVKVFDFRLFFATSENEGLPLDKSLSQLISQLCLMRVHWPPLLSALSSPVPCAHEQLPQLVFRPQFSFRPVLAP